MIEVQLSNRREARIGEHVFVVRRLGAGEELSMMQLSRELDKLDKKEEQLVNAYKSTQDKIAKAKGEDKVTLEKKLSDMPSGLSEEEVDKGWELSTSIYNLIVGCFETDQPTSKQFLKTLSRLDVEEIYDQVFKPKIEVEDEPAKQEKKAGA